MQFSAGEGKNLPISKFESMLKTNEVYFFDSTDFEQIIHHYLDEGKIALAKKAIKIGLEQHTTSINLRLLNIEVLVFENELDLADKLLNELLVIENSNEEIYIQKANIYSKKDDHKKAIELLKIALTYAEDITDIYSLIGMEYLFMDDYNSAKNYFIKCLDIDFEDYSSLYNIIYCFEFSEDHDGAIEFLNGYLDVNPYCEVAWHQLGKQFFAKEMYKEALASFDFAIISDDIFIGAYLEKAKVLEKMGRINEAIENYEMTVAIDDPTSFAYLRIGKCHEKLGNIEIARQYYFKTVQEDPLLDKGWIAITDFYFKQTNYKKALYYINKAINIDSENVLYWKKSAEISIKLSQYEEADLSFQKAVELGNYELETWLSWSNVLIILGEYDSAIQTLLQAFDFYPDDVLIEYRLAGCYFLSSEYIKGTYYLKNALRNNHDQLHIFKELFPLIFERKTVKDIITEFKNAST